MGGKEARDFASQSAGRTGSTAVPSGATPAVRSSASSRAGLGSSAAGAVPNKVARNSSDSASRAGCAADYRLGHHGVRMVCERLLQRLEV